MEVEWRLSTTTFSTVRSASIQLRLGSKGAKRDAAFARLRQSSTSVRRTRPSGTGRSKSDTKEPPVLCWHSNRYEQLARNDVVEQKPSAPPRSQNEVAMETQGVGLSINIP